MLCLYCFRKAISDIVIEENHTHNTVESGIIAWGSQDVVIDVNEVELACNDGQNECITVGATDSFEVRFNHVHHGGFPARTAEKV